MLWSTTRPTGEYPSLNPLQSTDEIFDRWRIISGKVGSGFTPAACRDKAQEVEAETEGNRSTDDAEDVELEDSAEESSVVALRHQEEVQDP